MKEQRYEINTRLSVQEIAAIFRNSLAESSRNVEFGKIDEFDNPFSQFDRADFSAYASEKALLPRNNFAIQIYVFDEGSQRRVSVIAMGTKLTDQFFLGGNSIQLAAGKKKAALVVDQIQYADHRGQRIRS